MSLYENQVARMKELMNIGNINEEKKSLNTNIVEYQATGADGKTYGIVREGTKYYIKVAPKKDTEIVAEDYDYIGGFCNKKQYEYNSYSNASKNLELKLLSLKESLCSNEPIKESYEPYKKMDVIIEQTDSMRKEIQRQKEIMHNASLLMNEESKIGFNNTGLPEAPKTATNSNNQNSPFTEKAKAELDKDNIEKSTDHKKKAPFDENGEVSDSDMQSDKNPKCSSCSKNAPHTEDAKFVPKNSVANQKPKGGKVVKVNESKKHVVRMTEEQVLSWNSNKDYMDTSTETNIGDTAPFTQKVSCDCKCDKNECNIDEDVAMWAQGDNINSPQPGNGEIGDGQPFEQNVSEESDSMDSENFAGFGDENSFDNEPSFEDEWESWVNDGANPDEVENNVDDFSEDFNDSYSDNFNEYDENLDDEYIDERPFESKRCKKSSKKINEDKLDVFGKTPGYRKKPMTLPPNTEVAPNGAKDWNDSSVEGEEPFGKQIGSSAPYTELVKQITNAIVTAINKNVSLKKKA